MSIMLSVICNTYNHEKYIEKTLNGFIMQKTDFEFEVLIHDDASTDNTANIIREYEKKYPNIIKPIYQTENQYSKHVTITSTFQHPRIKGKYIAVCEGDDYWTDENKLQKQVDFLEKNPSYVACVHKYIVVDENNQEQDVKTFGYYENEETYTLKDFETKELPSQFATIVYRNVFRKYNNTYPKAFLDIKMRQGDIKCFLFLLCHGDIYRMKDVMSAYRFVCKKGGASWSSRSLLQCNGYKKWCAIKKLEQTVFDVLKIKVNLKNRKVNCAVETLLDLRKKVSFENFKNAMIVILKQPGLFGKVINLFIRKLQNAKNK